MEENKPQEEKKVSYKGKLGGYRPGGGRPKGSKTKESLQKEEMRQHIVDRVRRTMGPILNSQVLLATGQTFLYRIDKEERKVGKDTYYVNKKPVLVDNQAEIESYLERKVEEGDIDDRTDPSAAYYFITAKEPNNQAIDSLWNRGIGKVRDDVDITTNGKDLPTPLLHVLKKKE